MVDVKDPPKTRKAIITQPDGTKSETTIRLVQVADITVDSRYQRDIDQDWVQAQVRDGWDERRAGVILLSVRGGRLLCIDGQGRVELARQVGIPQLWAQFLTGLTQQQEADLFELLQTKRRQLKVWELFKARTASNKADVLDISRTVHQVGLRIDKAGGDQTITALGALMTIYRIGGVELLRDTLTTIKRLWALDDPRALSGQIMHGVALFLHAFANEPQFRMERLEAVMPVTAPAKLLRLAQDIASRRQTMTVGASVVGEALRDIYNKGMGPEMRLGALHVRKGR